MDFEKFILSENLANLSDEYVLKTFVTKCDKDEDFIQLFQLRELFNVSPFISQMVEFIKAKDVKGLQSFTFNLMKKYEIAHISCHVYAYFISKTLAALKVKGDEIFWIDPRKNDLSDITYSGNAPTLGMGGYHEKKEDFDIINGRLISIKSDEKIITIPNNLVTSIEGFEDRRGGTSNIIGVLLKKNNVSLLSIPYSVQNIGKEAFKDANTVQTVLFPPTINKIPEGMFKNCVALGRVLASGVSEIGKNAFENSGLSSVGGFSADELEKVQAGAFRNCKQLKKIDLPDTYFSVSSLAGTSSLKLLSFKAHERIKMMKMLFMKDEYDKNPVCTVEHVRVKFPDGKIPAGYFQGLTSLKEIYVDGAITEIGDNAFTNCIELEKLFLEYNGEVIPHECFKGCKKLKSLPAFKNASIISEGAFDGMESLANLQLANEVQIISKNSFKDCKSLQGFPFKYVGDSLPSGAFEGMDNVDITPFLNQIKEFAPYSAANIKIPEGFKIAKDVKKICANAFAGSTFPENFVLSLYPDTIYEEEAFKDTNIKAINYETLKLKTPSGDEIEPYQLFVSSKEEFKQKYQISRIVVNVEEIPENSFSEWENLKLVGIGANVKAIKKGAFANCKLLYSIKNKATGVNIYDEAFMDCINLGAISNDGSESEVLDLSFASFIGANAFKGCAKFKNVDAIKVGKVSPFAFANCVNLSKISVTIAKPYIDMGYKFFNLFNSDIDKFNQEIMLLKEVKVAFPDKEIPEGFFEGLKNVTNIEIEGEINVLGKKAFRNCPELTGFSLNYKGDIFPSYCFEGSPKVEIAKFLSEASVYEAYSLSNLTFPKSFKLSPNLKKVEAHAFENSVFAENFVLELNNNSAFEALSFKGTNIHNIRFSSFELKDGEGKVIKPYQLFEESYEEFDKNYKIARIIISCNDIPEGAFKGWKSLVQVIIDENVKIIPNHCFEDCTSLEGIKFRGDGVILGDRAFYNCNNLSTIKNGVSEEAEENVIDLNFVKKIGAEAFTNCSSFTKINADNVSHIDKLVFAGCENINEVDLKISNRFLVDNRFFEFFADSLDAFNEKFNKLNNITVSVDGYLSESFFEGLKNISSITIKGTLNDIGPRCFKGDENLEELLFLFVGEEIKESTFEGLEKLNAIPNMDNVQVVRKDAFKYCNNLKEINLSDKLILIETGAFKGCSNLVRLESEIYDKEIRDETFKECVNLEYVDLTNIAKVAKSAFEGVEKYNYVISGAIETPISEVFPNAHIKKVKYIGKRIPGQFYSDLKELEEVEFSNLIAIGPYAFEGCELLEKLPDTSSVQYIGDYALSGTAIKEFKVEKDIPYLGVGVFAGDQKLEKLSLPLVDKSLVELFSLEEVEGAKEVVSVDENKYYVPSSLKEVEVTKYSNGGNFAGLDFDIIFKDEIEEIPTGFLSNYTGNIDINFEKVRVIHSSAFENSKIEKLDLPNIEVVEKEAFKNMGELNELSFGKGLVELDESVFNNPNIISVHLVDNDKYSGSDGVILNKETGYILFVNRDACDAIHLEDEAKVILKDAFKGCNLITELYTNRVEEIQTGAFVGLEDLEILHIENKNCKVAPHILEGSNKLKELVVPSLYIDDASVSLNYYLSKCEVKEGLNIQIQSGPLINGFTANYGRISYLDVRGCDLKVIGKNIFKDLEIDHLVLPDEIEEIDEQAFVGAKIKEIESDALEVENNVLYFQDKLILALSDSFEELKIKSGTTYIYPHAFEGFKEIKSLIIEEEEIKLNHVFIKFKLESLRVGEVDFHQEFSGSLSSLKRLSYLGYNLKESSITKFTSLKSIELFNVEEVNPNVLYFDHEIDEIIFENVVSINDYAFGKYDITDNKYVKVKLLKINNEVKEISENAFYNVFINKIELNESSGDYVSSLGAIIDKKKQILLYVQKGDLDEFEYLERLEEIAPFAFYGLNKLTKVHLKDVRDIKDGAFMNCSSLEKVIIGKSLAHLGKHILEGTKVSTLQIPFIGKDVDHPESLQYLYNINKDKLIPLRHLYLSKQKDVSNYPFRKSMIETVLLSDEVEEIKDETFAEMNLDHVIIPKGVKTISGRPFKGVSPKNKRLKVYVATDVNISKDAEKVGLLAKAEFIKDKDEWEKVYRDDMRMRGFYEND
ncbi:MAG: leucine-rich repeat domain-containing protein [Bacilli bacterium]|nr:leucine-rich repeat domain-containing protein [Bacilli bacterium]